mgnify:CR=1 FL=1|tara:strand:+ start:1118 stop:1969 length:852 start_codon:yes stop_codon:yes gene_type:complete
MEVKRLKELETHEVSIVDRPANRRTFLVLKNETSTGEKDMEDKILSLLDTPFENEEQYLETLKKNEMSDDAIQTIVAAMRLLKPHQEALSGENINVVKELLGIEKEEKTSEDNEGTADTELDINEVPEDVRDQVESLFKSQSEAIQKAEELEKEINVMKAEKMRKQFIQKAESSFGFVPGTTAVDLGELLQELTAVAPEATAKIESILETVNKAMETSEVLEEAGQAVKEESGTAWDKVEARAADLRKDNPDLSVYQARAKVLESNTELFQAYNNEFESNKRS